MNRRTLAVGMVAAMGFGLGLTRLFAHDEKNDPSGLPLCPVMDEPVDVSVSVATDDGPVYFCCAGCIEKFEAKPDEYAEKVSHQREHLKDWPKVQVKCPVSGKPADHEVSVEHEGRKVYFCCPRCPDAYKADPAKFEKKLANSFSFQTMCPVSGEEIDPKTATTLATGQTLYFCCPKCSQKLLSDPASFVKRLETIGIHLDPAKIAGERE